MFYKTKTNQKNKNFYKIMAVLFVFSFIFSNFVFAENKIKEEHEQKNENAISVQALEEVYILYKKSNWQTYDFKTSTNVLDESKLNYAWEIDGNEIFYVPELKYYFTHGQHRVKVAVTDQLGNTRHDTLALNINFWSLHNNWFWWALYLVLVMLIFYYWVVKLIYLFNRKRFSKQVDQFLSFLDEHGWIEQIIEKRTKNRNHQ